MIGVEEAAALGKRDAEAGVNMPNPYAWGTPEAEAWRVAFVEANQLRLARTAGTPAFDAVAYAREMGEAHAKAGPGFNNPYPSGSLQGRAWREAYDRTPKGVPQTSGPRGRGEDELAAGVSPHATPSPTKVGEPLIEGVTSGDVRKSAPGKTFTELVTEAFDRGRLDCSLCKPIRDNPYAESRPTLAEAWENGWLKRDAELAQVRKVNKIEMESRRVKLEQDERTKELIEKLNANLQPLMQQFEPVRFINPGPSLAQMALRLLPTALDIANRNNLPGSTESHAVHIAFDVASAFLAEMEKRFPLREVKCGKPG